MPFEQCNATPTSRGPTGRLEERSCCMTTQWIECKMRRAHRKLKLWRKDIGKQCFLMMHVGHAYAASVFGMRLRRVPNALPRHSVSQHPSFTVTSTMNSIKSVLHLGSQQKGQNSLCEVCISVSIIARLRSS
jgi:hypothetical protein